MARNSSPWYWPERQAWYTIVNGQRQPLGPHPDDAPPPHKNRGKWVAPPAIQQAFHAMLAKQHEEPPPGSTPATGPSANDNSSGITVIEVLDKYLGWCKKHRAARTYDWYHDHIQGFINHAGQLVHEPASSLKPFHVTEWADAHADTWSPAYRRGAIVALQRPFNWAEELGYVSHSPIKKIAKPQAQRREQFIAPADWEKIKNHYAEGDPFRTLLEFAWESGCRPQESKCIEARHADLANHRILFPPDEAKGKKRWRIIRLTPRAEEIIKHQLEQHPEGVLFRNEDGQPWTAYAVGCRFGRLEKHLGVRYCATAFRHGFAQDLLEQGADPLTVSELLGHADGAMLARVYSHMSKADSHLQKVLERRAGKDHGAER